MARDIKRIRKFCEELATIWEDNCPDWRFGQFVLNVLGEMSHQGKDPFFPEEKEMLIFMENYFKKKESKENDADSE